MLMVGVGSDSCGFGSLSDVEEFVDGDDVPAAGAAASVSDSAGEQVAGVAAAFAGEPVAAVGAFVDAAGRSGNGRGQRRWNGPARVAAGSVGGLSAAR